MKKFLVGVGDVVAVQNGQVVAHSKTMLNTGFEVSTSNTEIRGGKGNQLQYVYYHTGALSVTLEDTQWQLPWIMLNTGASFATGGTFWKEETIVASGTTVQLDGTPIAVDGDVAYGYVNYKGTIYACPFADGELDIYTVQMAPNDTACVGYFYSDPTGETITIPANIIPDTVHLFITAQLASDSTGSGILGEVTVEIPLAQLSGAQTITMTADGYSTTPLTANALAYTDTTGGCSAGAYYAKISERIENGNVLDGISSLAVAGGNFGLVIDETAVLRVYAVKEGRSFLVDNKLLTFTSASTTIASVGQHTGLVTALATGGAAITVNYGNVRAYVNVTVTAS